MASPANAVTRPSDEELKLYGPHKLMREAMVDSIPVLISYRDDHKFLGHLLWFDKHCNALLQHVREMWWSGGEIKEREIEGVFLRGDGVICVMKACAA